MTATPEERAEGICALLARGEAAFDKRGWVEMPKADRERYVERALIVAPLIAQAIREAVRDELAGLAVHIEHAMDTLTDSERQPSVIGAYVRDWAMKPKTPKD